MMPTGPRTIFSDRLRLGSKRASAAAPTATSSRSTNPQPRSSLTNGRSHRRAPNWAGSIRITNQVTMGLARIWAAHAFGAGSGASPGTFALTAKVLFSNPALQSEGAEPLEQRRRCDLWSEFGRTSAENASPSGTRSRRGQRPCMWLGGFHPGRRLWLRFLKHPEWRPKLDSWGWRESKDRLDVRRQHQQRWLILKRGHRLPVGHGARSSADHLGATPRPTLSR